MIAAGALLHDPVVAASGWYFVRYALPAVFLFVFIAIGLVLHFTIADKARRHLERYSYSTWFVSLLLAGALTWQLESMNHSAPTSADEAVLQCGAYSICAVLAGAIFILGGLQWRRSNAIEVENAILRQQLGEEIENREAAVRLAAQAKDDHDFLLIVNELMLSVVAQKGDRIKAFRGRIHRKDLPHTELMPQIAKVQDPNRQVGYLLAATWTILRTVMIKEGYASASLRLALYRPRENTLELEFGYDGTDPKGRKHNIRGPTTRANEPRFDLTGSPLATSAAVYVAKEGGIHVVENAADAHSDSHDPFHHFDGKQSSRIGSLLAAALGEEANPGCCRRVLCVDSNQAGVFKKVCGRRYELLRTNLEQRILLELDSVAVYNQIKSSNPTPNPS